LVLFEGGSVKKWKNNSFVIKLLEIDWAVWNTCFWCIFFFSFSSQWRVEQFRGYESGIPISVRIVTFHPSDEFFGWL
jgi:hypothetical protein